MKRTSREQKMTCNINGASVVNEYLRREIPHDRLEHVAQGVLRMWLFNNCYVCELRINADDLAMRPGQWSISGGPYINTYSPQEIADHLEKSAI